MASRPALQAMWLVDDVEQDEDGKMNVTGLFDKITVKSGQTHYTTPAFIFFSMRGTHGPVMMTLSYVDLADGAVLMEVPITAGEDNPLMTHCVCHLLPPIPVPHQGCYVWELRHEDEVIGEARQWAFVTDEGTP